MCCSKNSIKFISKHFLTCLILYTCESNPKARQNFPQIKNQFRFVVLENPFGQLPNLKFG